MALDNKYGYVKTQLGDIGEDEQVVVFRGRDRLLPKVLKIYHILCELAGSPQHHLAAIDEAAAKIKMWQAEHLDLVRLPNSNAYVERIARERGYPGARRA
jgi:hypothetical protein